MNNNSNKLRKIFILLGPVVFMAVLFSARLDPSHPEAGRTAAIAALMAFYWITEALPLAVTAMFPVVLYPLLGVMRGKDVAPVYFNSIIFVFIGGFIVALAMERWRLHKRIALKIILSIGRSLSTLILGFMASAWFLSMWISNTATMMMMIPIVLAILLKLEEGGAGHSSSFQTAILLGVAYAASIGGMATIIGTPPNLAFVKIFSISFPFAEEVSFVKWFFLAFPLSLVFFILTFLILRVIYLRHVDLEINTSFLLKEYKELGKASYEEKTVLTCFIALAILWMTRADIHIGGKVLHGWSSLFGHPSYIDDGTVAIFIALLLFLLPSKCESGSIMNWQTAKKLPWGIVLLFGGGFALAKGFHDSGLSAQIGDRLTSLHSLPTFLVIFVICAMITFLTELTSNTATTQVVLPIIASLSTAISVNPLLLMVPATISASCAFMLPVATPPNAIVFGTNRLRVSEMARTGLLLNIVGVILVTIFFLTIGRFVLGIG